MARRGDIILFFYKYDPIAWLIRLASHSNWNHIGIMLHGTVILDLRATQKRTAHIRYFLRSSIYRMKLLRIKGLTQEAREHVINAINKEPKVRIYYKMLWKFLLMFLGIPSDICNNCAEVIARPLREKGFDICPGKDVRLINPEDFNKSDLTEDISNELTYKETL